MVHSSYNYKVEDYLDMTGLIPLFYNSYMLWMFMLIYLGIPPICVHRGGGVQYTGIYNGRL